LGGDAPMPFTNATAIGTAAASQRGWELFMQGITFIIPVTASSRQSTLQLAGSRPDVTPSDAHPIEEDR